ncbi:MAG: LysR family transcriptional regulator [Naasia sp.]|nr:LysR family transcriptional regulator [Naasia sp.]
MVDLTTPEFSLRQLRYFVAAAVAGSTLGAASAMYVSQSTMSASLSEFEKALGTQLFVRRRGRGIELTETGRQLLPRARQLLSDADEFRSAASSLQEELRGPLTIACFTVIAASILPRVLAGFGARHPDVRVDFVDGDREEVLDALETGRAEVALTFQRLVPATLPCAVLAQPVPHLLVPPGHRLAGTRPVSLRELGDETFILVEADPATDFVSEAFRASGIDPPIRFRSRSLTTVRALVARGLGVTLVAQGSRLDGRVAPDGVVAVPVSDAGNPDPIVIASAGSLTRRGSAFWDFCVEELG